MTIEAISPDMKGVLRRLKLGRLLDTLPQRLILARQQSMPHTDFLLLILGDEVSRREGATLNMRIKRANLDPGMRLEQWDPGTPVSYDRVLFNELVSLRFLEAHGHVAVVGPVGVGKTFLAQALGHLACQQGYEVLVLRCDRMLKTLKQGRLDRTYDEELDKILAVDLLILDDFGLDAMDPVESRDAYEIMTERDGKGSIIITSNRGPDEWLGTFADPVRAQSAIDRFTSRAYDLVMDGESYRQRLKPTLKNRSAVDTKEAILVN